MSTSRSPSTDHRPPQRSTRVAALIGSKGMLAQMVRQVAPPEYELHGFDLPDFDLTDRQQVLDTLTELGPQLIVNCAAYTDVDGCESQEEPATRVNGDGPGHLAAAARETGATLVHLSTDYVFDGTGNRPYREEDPTNPRSAYGRSKLAGEEAIRESGLERYFIIRTSWLYGPGGKNFVETMIRLAKEREELRVVADQVGSPTYTEDLARAVYNLLDPPSSSRATDQGFPASSRSPITDHRPPVFGLYHFANEGRCSWHEFATEIIARYGKDHPVKTQEVVPITTEEYPVPAKRPAYSVLSKEKYKGVTGAEVPHWKDGLERYLSGR